MRITIWVGTIFLLSMVSLAAQDLNPQKDAPKVNAEQKSDSPLKRQDNSKEPKTKTEENSATVPKAPAKSLQQEASHNAGESRDEGTEYWPRFWGVHLKITDSLLALFTFLLVLFTGLLWRSTDKLWAAGERQIGVARQSADAAVEALTGNRAWLLFGGINVMHFSNGIAEDGTGGHSGIGFSINWQNFGITPAISPEVYVQGDILDIQDIKMPVFKFGPYIGEKRSFPIAPN